MLRALICGGLLTLAASGGGWTLSGLTDWDGQPDRPKQTPDYDFAVTKIIGKPVENAEREPVGKVVDLIVARDHRVTHAVLSVGGFLGVGNYMVAVPIERLQLRGDKVFYDVSREQLSALPEFVYRPDPPAPPLGARSGADVPSDG